MKEKTKGLNDRDLEILDILGFDGKDNNSLLLFLEKTLKTADISNLHDQGIALRSVKMILKKIKPYHKVFVKKQYDNFCDDNCNLSSAENVGRFISSFSASTQQEVSAAHYW